MTNIGSPWISLLWGCAVLLGSLPAHAERYGILVGNNRGRGMDAPLRFAETDAQRLSKVLAELGRFPSANLVLLPSPSMENVESAFAEVSAKIAAKQDKDAMVFFYYSGHADGSTLHLGETSLDLVRIKDLLQQTRASVRIGVLDACGTGALTEREKGFEKGRPFRVSAPSELAQRGQVILAAVSASESAQESDALKGSFFTSYLISGLRGAADRLSTGRVTLDDVYRYAYAQTVRATMLSRSGAQHPSYDVDLSGQGDLILTEPRNAKTRLLFRAQNGGELAIFTPQQELYVEASMAGDQEILLALPAGEYEVRKRAPDGLRVAKIVVVEGRERELQENVMPRLEYVRLARKGFNSRLRIAAGYNYGTLASRYGSFLARMTLELGTRRLLLSPRLSFSFTGASEGYRSSTSSYSESFTSLGMFVGHPWELSRWFFTIGGAVNLGLTWQHALGRASWAFAFNVSASTTVGLRLFRGLSATLDVEPGLTFPRTEEGLGVRPNITSLLGVRYEL